MNRQTKILVQIMLCLILTVPLLTFAAQTQPPPGGLIPCTNTPDKDGKIDDPCGFPELIKLVDKVINFILFALAVPIAAIMFTYAGFKLVISAGSSEARTSARKIFTNAVIGLVLAGAAWLIIKLILVITGFKSIDTFFK